MSEKQPDKICFVIAPIGEADSETRKRSDQVLKHIIRPAVAECGYTAIRADEIDKPGIITSQVIQHVVNDPLVVADLTEWNPNVFYELAIRHALRKPLVQLIQKGEKIPFDVAATRTISFDRHDLDSVDLSRAEIVKQIQALENDGAEMETPISVSLDLQVLRQSGNPEDRSLADIVSAVAELRAGMVKIEAKLGGKESGSSEEMAKELLKIRRRLDDLIPSHGLGRAPTPHPGAVQDLMHSVLGKYTAKGLNVLMAASLFKDSLPWLYEYGIDVFRQLSNTPGSKSEETLSAFRELLQGIIRGPWRTEFIKDELQYRSLIDAIDYLDYPPRVIGSNIVIPKAPPVRIPKVQPPTGQSSATSSSPATPPKEA